MNAMRNYGIDLYRIVLTFFICMLHVLGQGGILGVSEDGTALFGIVWLLETSAYCAVDGYGLISGYNAKEKGQNFTRIICLWFQVFFYSFVFSQLTMHLTLKMEYMNSQCSILSNHFLNHIFL